MPLIHASRLDTSPPVYIVEGLLPDLGTGFGYGPSYSGKTLVLAIELCLAIANGVPFFGHATVQGSAVWCLGEGLADAGVRIKARLIREQTDRKRQAAGIADRDGQAAADEWLASLPPYTDDHMYVRTTAFRVPFSSQDEPSEALRQAAAELSLIPDLRLVVLDTARRFSSLSLSNGTTANRFMMGMSWLSEQLQSTVLAIGHPVSKPHGEIGLPGETLFGASDFVWLLRPAETSTADTPSGLIVAEKVKSGSLFPAMAYGLEPIEWEQPPTDPDTGLEILGVPLIKVSSVTVRQQDSEDEPDTSALMPQPGRSLPDGQPVERTRPRRRSGILPAQSWAFRPVQQSRTPLPAGQEPDGELAELLISGACPVCAAEPGSVCPPGEQASELVILTSHPLITAHIARLQERIDAGVVTLTDVRGAFPPGTAPDLRAGELAGASA